MIYERYNLSRRKFRSCIPPGHLGPVTVISTIKLHTHSGNSDTWESENLLGPDLSTCVCVPACVQAWYICMCVWICICLPVSMHGTCVCVYLCPCMVHMCVCVCVCMYMPACVHAWYIYVCVCVCMYMPACVHVWCVCVCACLCPCMVCVCVCLPVHVSTSTFFPWNQINHVINKFLAWGKMVHKYFMMGVEVKHKSDPPTTLTIHIL